MNWEQKMQALQALGEVSLRMRKPGDWYVASHTEVKDGPILKSDHGNGATPQDAIEDEWMKKVTNLGSKVLIIDAGRSCRRAVRWNGFMWQNIVE